MNAGMLQLKLLLQIILTNPFVNTEIVTIFFIIIIINFLLSDIFEL